MFYYEVGIINGVNTPIPYIRVVLWYFWWSVCEYVEIGALNTCIDRVLHGYGMRFLGIAWIK